MQLGRDERPLNKIKMHKRLRTAVGAAVVPAVVGGGEVVVSCGKV